MKLLGGLLLFLLLPSAWAETEWEKYLANPTSEQAARVNKIEATDEGTKSGGDNELQILQNQVLAQDSQAFRLAYRLCQSADGGLMLKEVVRGLLSPARRKAAAKMLMERYCTSERKACALVGLSRTAWRYMPLARDDEAPFRAEVIRLPLKKWIILSNQAEPPLPPMKFSINV